MLKGKERKGKEMKGSLSSAGLVIGDTNKTEINKLT